MHNDSVWEKIEFHWNRTLSLFSFCMFSRYTMLAKNRLCLSWKKTYWQWYWCIVSLNRNRNESAVRTQLELKAFQCAFLYLWIRVYWAVYWQCVTSTTQILRFRFFILYFWIEMMFLSCLTRTMGIVRKTKI